MKTTRLFDQNSHLYTFEATVLSAEAGKSPDTLSVVLDATAFFPEGGGQYADKARRCRRRRCRRWSGPCRCLPP